MFETLLLIGFFMAGISQMIPESKGIPTPVKINREGLEAKRDLKVHTSEKKRVRSGETASRKGMTQKKQIKASRIQAAG